MVFFTADTHFNHEAIIGHCNRAYRSVAEMNEALVARWNEVVLRENDEVWVLGDFGFVRKDAEDLLAIFWRLRGRKYLVVGNHDEKNPQVLRLPWEKLTYLHTFKKDGVRAELCHYPMESWNQSHHGALHFHGHSHGTMGKRPRRFDVGWDVWGRPVEFEVLVELAAKETFIPTDHHGRS